MLGLSLDEAKGNKLFNQLFDENQYEKVGDQSYYTNRKEGIGVVFNRDDILTAFHLHSGGKQGYSKYSGDLPENIQFGLDRNSIVRNFEDIRFDQGGGEVLPILGATNKWIKFYFENSTLHLEFNSENRLVMVTIEKG